MVFRFCREPPLRAAIANVEEMHVFSGSFRCAGQLEEAGAEKHAVLESSRSTRLNG